MRVPESDWRVELERGSSPSNEHQEIEVEASTQDEAEERALGLADGMDWRVRKAVRLCDFCAAAHHPRVEAYTEITVVDESDVMDAPPDQFEAPERCAWVCYDHYEVVQALPTYRAAPEAE